jgi:hypothetical protein
MATPPQDLTAEQIILGVALWSPQAITHAQQAGIHSYVWADPRHTDVWHALLTLQLHGAPTHPTAVCDELRRRGRLQFVGGPLYVNTLYEAASSAVPEQVGHYAGIVLDHHRSREMLQLAQRLHQIAYAAEPNWAAARQFTTEWLEDNTSARRAQPPLELDDFLAQTDEDETYDWIIPGLLERHDRFILTGPEGGGKSTFLRQLAIQAASGIHPVTGDRFDPATVLYVDLENSPSQMRRKLRPLRLAAGDHYQRGRLHLEIRPEGIDLTTSADREWLSALAEGVKPSLIVIGPLYKAANGDPTEEKSSKPVAVALDQLRVDTGAALLIEAHASKVMHGRKRAIEPYGWSGWLRWPEFGIHLSPGGEVSHWRGQRDERAWPTAFQRGGNWPWTPVTDEGELRWLRILQARSDFGEPMTERDVVDATGMPKTTVHRILAKHAQEWQVANAQKVEDDE